MEPDLGLPTEPREDLDLDELARWVADFAAAAAFSLGERLDDVWLVEALEPMPVMSAAECCLLAVRRASRWYGVPWAMTLAEIQRRVHGDRD